MAYKASRSRRNFELGLRPYFKMLRSVDTNATDPQIRQYVIAATIFLSHASLENYIRDLFDGICSAFTFQTVPGKQLPKELRVFIIARSSNLESYYSNFHASGDEGKLLANLSNILKNPKRTLIDDGLPIPKFTGPEIISGKSYPSADNLQKIFHRIGIPKIFSKLTAELRSDSELLLKGFSDKRTELAHNAVIPGTSAQDVADEIKRITKFVAALDRISYRHVTGLVSQKIWFSQAC